MPGTRSSTDEQVLDRGVHAPAELLVRGLKVFASPPGQPRARRATDLVLLVAGLAGLAVLVAAYPPSGFELALQRFLAAIPDWLDPIWVFLSNLTWFFAVVLLVIALARLRFAVLLQAAGSLVIAAALGLVVVRIAVGSWPDLPETLLGTAGSARFPYVRLAEAAAVIVAASPHLAHPWRRTGRWVLTLGAIGVAVTALGTPLGALAALLIGIVAAAGARLVGGTSAGRPGIDDVEAALAQLGIAAGELEIAERQAAGVFLVRGVDPEGRRLLVKIYGRDAHDTQLLVSLWRTLWYRGKGMPLRLGRLQAVEHEAFVTLLARGAGVATHDVVTAGATIDDDAVLVLRGDVAPFDTLGASGTDDAALDAAWQMLARLDAAKLAHQQIEPSTLALVDGVVGLTDFARATVSPDATQLATDRAQLYVTLAAVAGPAPAQAAAVRALGADGASALLPYLQTAAFSPVLRRQLKAADIDVDDVRDELAQAVGVEPPDPIKIRRVTWWSAIQLVLLALASYTIVDAASGVDWSQVWGSVTDASLEWIVVAFVVAQLPRLTQSLTTLGSVPTTLPFGPVYAMQLAMGYMNVALPSNLARMVINIRFFQRQGLSAPIAVASGAIDSFFGTLVQGVLLVLLLLFSESSLAFDVSVPSGATWKLAALLLLLVIGAILVVSLVPRLRNPIVAAVQRFWPDVRRALGALRASRKLALLVLGSLGTEVLFALALGLFAQAFGYDISLAELLVINISVSLLATIVPIPGGVGVAEFGLTLGLTAAGMEPEAAIAAVLLYRISTFYLPPFWGFFAMQWLQRNRYL